MNRIISKKIKRLNQLNNNFRFELLLHPFATSAFFTFAIHSFLMLLGFFAFLANHCRVSELFVVCIFLTGGEFESYFGRQCKLLRMRS